MHRSLLLAISFLLISYISIAQKGIMMGKVTYDKGKPVKHPEFIAVNDLIHYQAKINPDGLYYTDSMLPGNYNIFILVDNVPHKAKVTVKHTTRQTFYNFKLVAEKAVLSITDNDPYMAKALIDAKKEPAKFIY